MRRERKSGGGADRGILGTRAKSSKIGSVQKSWAIEGNCHELEDRGHSAREISNQDKREKKIAVMRLPRRTGKRRAAERTVAQLRRSARTRCPDRARLGDKREQGRALGAPGGHEHFGETSIPDEEESVSYNGWPESLSDQVASRKSNCPLEAPHIE